MSVFLLEVRGKSALVLIAKGKNSNCLEYRSSCSHIFCFLGGIKDSENDEQTQNSLSLLLKVKNGTY